MNSPEKISKAKSKELDQNRTWRLAKDVVITPVEEIQLNVLKQIDPEGKIPKDRFGIQRKNVRAFPKIVSKDVVEVLNAFGEKGATYNQILEHFIKARNLNREELDPGLGKLVISLVRNNFLVDADPKGAVSAESVKPSFQKKDRWLKYEIKENIHCIVDSEIYKVEDTLTKELRALKIIQDKFPNQEMKEYITQRLNHEFDVIRKIDHPNVVKLWEHGTHQGRTYGILDWVDGPNVVKYVYDLPARPKDVEIMKLGVQCLEAVRAVHNIGYLHGDVHTGNFLLKNGQVCLIDFGLSRPIQLKKSEESKYSQGGVIMFMPPEAVRKQLNKEKGFWGSVAGEVYSCGVILFSLFTRQYPYKWKLYREDYMRSILSDPPLCFEECERNPWPELESVLRKAMSKKPEDRFSSVTEFLEALKKVPIPDSSASVQGIKEEMGK